MVDYLILVFLESRSQLVFGAAFACSMRFRNGFNEIGMMVGSLIPIPP
jgi:hypothetical protein